MDRGVIKGVKDGSNANPEIYLEPIENNLAVKIKLQAESFERKDRFQTTKTTNTTNTNNTTNSQQNRVIVDKFDNVLNRINDNTVENHTIQYICSKGRAGCQANGLFKRGGTS